MRAALERVEALARPASIVNRSAFVPIGLAAGLAALVAAAVFAGGGSTEDTLHWVGGGALVLALGACSATLLGAIGRPQLARPGYATLALLVAFVVWNGASVLWSIAPDRSWDYFNRGLVYIAFVLLGLFVGTLLPRAPVFVAGAMCALIAAALFWALAGKVFPALYPDGGRIARLRAPVEYWNGLALLFALGISPALWLAAIFRDKRFVRAVGVLFLYGLVVGILLTYSRAGVVAGILAAAGWVAVGPHRRDAVLALVVATPPGVAVAAWAFGQPGISMDRQDYSSRVAAGTELGVALFVGAVVVCALALLSAAFDRRRGPAPARPLLRRRLVSLGLAALAALLLSIIVLKGGEAVGWLRTQADEFANPPSEQLTHDPSRLTSVSSNHRWAWWQEAWSGFRDDPVFGTGAGTFQLTHRRLRDAPIDVVEPHNVALQFLSETGLIGLLLAGGATAAGFLAVGTAVRRHRQPEQAAGMALAVGLGVYAVHSLIDYDWDFLAVSAPAFAILGVLLGDQTRATATRAKRPAWALAAALVLAAGLFSLISPWVAEREVRASYDSLERNNPKSALDSARRAEGLNPVSIEPLLARSVAEISLGDLEAARQTLVRAVELQRENADAWLELAAFELQVAHEPGAAQRYVERALQLDPWSLRALLLRDDVSRALEAARA